MSRRRGQHSAEQQRPVEDALWRGLAVYRVLTLVFTLVLGALRAPGWERPLLGVAMLVVMTLWTPVVLELTRRRRRLLWVMVLDLLVASTMVLSTELVLSDSDVAAGSPTVSSLWASASVMGLAMASGALAALAGSLTISSANLLVRGDASWFTLSTLINLTVAAVLVGYLSQIALVAQERVRELSEESASSAERERMARIIHDSVLQTLALLARTGRSEEVGSTAFLMGEEAAREELRLRTLVSSRSSGGGLELSSALMALSGPRVEVVVPLEPVVLEDGRGEELVAAARAALENVRLHAGSGARANILLEDEEEELVLSVRDDGVGIANGALESARRRGRMGVSKSVVGRVEALGGSVEIISRTSGEAHGTEVEMRVPRSSGGTVRNREREGSR